jgi:predicted nuclease with TOPRIM domain
MVPKSASFLRACQANESEICGPLLSTLRGLNELWDISSMIDGVLKNEIAEAEKEFESITSETNKVLGEMAELSQESREVQKEVTRLEEARVSASGPTGHASQSYQSNNIDADSDVEIISPPVFTLADSNAQ